MAELTKQYTFTDGTLAEAAEVNQNFDDLVAFVNGELVHRDASTAFTAVPSGPATDPTSDNEFARKKYVDDHSPIERATFMPGKSGTLKFIVGTDTAVSNASGLGTIVFPKAFPGGCTVVLANQAELIAKPGVGYPQIIPYNPRVNAFDFLVVIGGAVTANQLVRVSYLAFGW